MRFEIVLSPRMKVSVGDLVQAWNATEACKEVGTVEVAKGEDQVYDAEVLEGGVALLDVGMDVDTHELYELLEQVLATKGVHEEVTMTPIDQPDGSRLLSITFKRDVND